ncbi:MAG TPA: hypothetical protein VD788_03405, partial [Candidatus Polarisedimenticolaceae bacterium]|nr:hypothetical protein [Candidatus Polarisedimenticolaceae bacterium]
ATSLNYHVLRSADGADFVEMTDCLVGSDPSSRSWTEIGSPVAGAIFHYLVRAVNDCPAGLGPLGPPGTSRVATSCP